MRGLIQACVPEWSEPIPRRTVIGYGRRVLTMVASKKRLGMSSHEEILKTSQTLLVNYAASFDEVFIPAGCASNAPLISVSAGMESSLGDMKLFWWQDSQTALNG
jgi:hypothetical protein